MPHDLPALDLLPKLTGKNPAVVAFTGAAGSGKDTAGLYLAEQYGFAQVAFAECINDMLADMLGYFGVDYAVLHERHLKEQPLPWLPGTPSARALKQTLGDWGRAHHPDFWVHVLATATGVSDMPRSSPVAKRLCITDVRYPNEAAFVASLGGVLVRLHRDTAEPVRAHSSETHVPALPATVEIDNSGLTPWSLYLQLDDLMDALGMEASA